MQRLSEQILAHAGGLPEGTPVSAKSLLHLGNRAAVDQALSRLVERGQLIRADRGVYLRPVTSRFGTRSPSVEQAVEALASQRGEVIVSSGAAAANTLGLTTQVPIRSVYLTSGRTRKMNLGKQVVELRHAPRWQLPAHRIPDSPQPVNCRVGGGVTAPTPHRPGRAVFPHPVPHGRVSLTVANE
ncbi:DUF6088 family protein [Mesorhizobium onobrychidis]|uniref:DUF6088 family protein n=1 Tax=Mesorhizobium onobrychidis TaxID=2775404 RepID=UPI002157B8BD|nr:DUF6088 family protein [Mesorhizobium onobrychidis]